MKVIYKYKITLWMNGPDVISIDPNFTFLKFGRDLNGDVCFWAIVDPNEKKVDKKIHKVMTGETLNKEVLKYKYLGTEKPAEDSNLIIHYFME